MSGLMNQAEVERERNAMDVSVQEASVGLQRESRFVLFVMNSAVFPVCSVPNVNLPLLMDKQESEIGQPIAESGDFFSLIYFIA